MVEEWREVVGYEGEYIVSNLGRVRSLPGGKRHGKLLKQALSGYPGNQYLHVGFRGTDTKAVHVLVARAFLGPRPEKLDVCHNNGDRLDNRLDNLRYGTRKENMTDRDEHGTNYWAQRTHCKNGHEFTPENTRVTPTRRWCRACERAAYHRRPKKMKSPGRRSIPAEGPAPAGLPCVPPRN